LRIIISDYSVDVARNCNMLKLHTLDKLPNQGGVFPSLWSCMQGPINAASETVDSGLTPT